MQQHTHLPITYESTMLALMSALLVLSIALLLAGGILVTLIER